MNFYILCVKYDAKVKNLSEIAERFGSVKVIEDIGYKKPNFCNLCSFKSVTSWDRLFYDIELEDSWMIEEDVCFSPNTFKLLINNTSNYDVDLISFFISPREKSLDWFWWHNKKVIQDICVLPKHVKSFNPICRLKKGLIEKILDYREKLGRFIYNEIMFASLSDSYMDIMNILHPRFFRFRPEIGMQEIKRGKYIYHPVKNELLHKYICRQEAMFL